MPTFSSAQVTDPFLSTGELLSPMAAYDTHTNALFKQQQDQQTIGMNDMSVVARAAAPLLGMSEEDAAKAYPGIVADLQRQGFGKQAPPTYPGHAVTTSLVQRGMTVPEQYQSGLLTAPGVTDALKAAGAPLSFGNNGVVTGGGGAGGTYAPGTPFTPKMLPPGVSLNEDAMVRTIAGEAGSEPLTGQIAVAHVINNRAKGAGVTPRDVVFSPNQFEPWNGGAARARLEAMQPTDPKYQAILNNVVRPVLAGQAADPTNGATHFYAPVAQQALGRPPPSWGQGAPSAVIGGHRFYSLGYGPGQARVAAAPDAAPTVAPTPFNPNVGPRVAGASPAGAPGAAPPGMPQAAPGITPPTAPGVNPNALVNFPPPTVTGQADETAPAVAQTKTAMRLNGTDVAGPPGVVPAPPNTPPNRLAYGTDLPGVTIGLPTNGMAPPQQTAAAPPPPVTQAPAAPIQAQPAPQPRTGQNSPQFQAAMELNRRAQMLDMVVDPTGRTKQMAASLRAQAALYMQADSVTYDPRTGIGTKAITGERVADPTEDLKLRRAKDAREEAEAKRAGLPEGYRVDDQGRAYRIDGLPPDPKVAQAAKDAFDAKQRENPVRGEGLDAQHENTVLQLYSSILDGTATPAQRALYALHYGAMKQGSPEWVDDPTKPGTKMLVRVPREIPSLFPSPDYKPGDPPPGASAGVQPIPGASKQDPMTMEQGKAAGYADRVQQALPVITDTSPAAMSRWQMLLGKAPILGNTFVSPEFQLHQQSERNFINAVLRRESGAAINPDEFVQARQQYIPQPGDSPQVLAEKAKNRETVLAGMIREAGPGYKPATGAATTTQPPTPKVIDYDATGKRVVK